MIAVNIPSRTKKAPVQCLAFIGTDDITIYMIESKGIYGLHTTGCKRAIWSNNNVDYHKSFLLGVNMENEIFGMKTH